MRLRRRLSTLDDAVLGNRLRGRSAGRRRGSGARAVLAVVGRVAALVLVLLALVCLVGVAFTLTPTNPANDVVRLVLDTSQWVAGPFKDVFTVSGDREREVVVNLLFAAAVYGIGALLVRRLSRGKD